MAQATASVDPDQAQHRVATKFSLERLLYSAAHQAQRGHGPLGVFVFESALLW
jgi:hypothetical protein